MAAFPTCLGYLRKMVQPRTIIPKNGSIMNNLIYASALLVIPYSLFSLSENIDRAEGLFNEQLYQDAFSFYEQTLFSDSDPKNVQFALSRMASCQLELGEAKQALIYLGKMEKPDRALQAAAFLKLGKYTEIIANLEGQTLNPSSRLARALAYYQLGEKSLARADFELISDRSQPEFSVARLYLARIALSNGEIEKAALFLEEIKSEPIYEELTDELLLLLAINARESGHKAEALSLLNKLIEEYPSSPLLADAWYVKADCSLDPIHKKECLQHIYIYYPKSPLAPQAYFNHFSYQEYLQGKRSSIKHLQALPGLFPNSPLVISAYYLIGLDQIKDRLGDDSTVIRLKNFTGAIEAFEKVEAAFVELDEKKLLGKESPYYTQVRYKAALEKAKAHLAIAKEAKGSKSQIYSKYAITAFETLSLRLDKNPKMQDECDFGLSEAYLIQGDLEKADHCLTQLIMRHPVSGDGGYLLAKAYHQKGVISLQKNDFLSALENFRAAEGAAMNFSVDEKLGLWIQMGLAYENLNQLSDAMSLYSKVINEDAVSGLRIEAMQMRANLYEKQGRFELARKQREAVAKKGGKLWR